MLKDWFKRISVVAITVAALVAGGAQAQAAPMHHLRLGGNEISLSMSTTIELADVETRASYTFSRSATERIYTAFRGSGIAGVTAICVAIAPGWLKVIGCAIFAQVVAAFLPNNPPDGQCLQVFTRLALPPIGVRYVDCP
jgi:hypothetical protein